MKNLLNLLLCTAICTTLTLGLISCAKNSNKEETNEKELFDVSSSPLTPNGQTNQGAADVNKQIFQQQYIQAESEYALTISKQLTSLKNTLSDLEKAASDNYSQYIKERDSLAERFAAMGLLNSGAYTGALKNLDDNYAASSAQYTKQIKDLEKQIASLQQEMYYPSPENVLTLLAQKNNMSYYEAVQKYNMYIANE